MVAGEFAPIVFGECACVDIERLDADLVAHRGAPAADTRDQLFDHIQLVEGWPVGITAAPVGIRLEPDGEGFGEILGRMRLCIPFAQMMDVAATTRTRFVSVWILK